MKHRWFTAFVAGLVVTGGMVLQGYAPAGGPAAGAEAALIARGQFGGAIDPVHHADGIASVYRLGDGQRVLRLENFTSTNGPNLFVYLSGTASPRNSAQLSAAGDFEVARLKGNIGNQNYVLPAGLDLSKFKSVVIYCRQFHVVFGSAPLARQ